MKKSILPLLFFGFLLLFAKPAIAQNENLINDIENYILKVDSLIMCCWDSLVISSNEITGHRKRGFGSISTSTYYNVCAIEWDKKSWYEQNEYLEMIVLYRNIFYTERRGIIFSNIIDLERIYSREYYEDGEVVAVIRKWERRRRLRKDRISKITVFINNNEIIYLETEGQAKNIQTMKEGIKTMHSLR
jgi:hypothetical protein